MPNRAYNPVTPGRRGATVSDYSDPTRHKKPEKNLTEELRKTGGRSNVGLTPGRGGQLARSAGTFAQLMAKGGNYADVLLPSGEIVKIHVRCRATVGQLGNSDSASINLGKAGRKRWLGVRPTVRGKAM